MDQQRNIAQESNYDDVHDVMNSKIPIMVIHTAANVSTQKPVMTLVNGPITESGRVSMTEASTHIAVFHTSDSATARAFENLSYIIAHINMLTIIAFCWCYVVVYILCFIYFMYYLVHEHKDTCKSLLNEKSIFNLRQQHCILCEREVGTIKILRPSDWS